MLGRADWNPDALRDTLRTYVSDFLADSDAVGVIDETGFLKKGRHSAGVARQYSGHPISLDFQGADLRSVLRIFSVDTGLNIVIDPAVQGTVDVALRDVRDGKISRESAWRDYGAEIED